MFHLRKIVLLLVLLNGYAYAQNQLKGKIMDQETSQPVCDAEIIIEKTQFGTTSDEQGQFILNIQENANEIIVKHLNYEQKKLTIDFQNIPEYVNIELIPLVRNIRGVVVEEQSDRVKLISSLPYLQEKITANELQLINTEDVGSVLRNSNNISGIRKGALGIDPVVRGYKFSQLNISVNNHIKVEGGCPNRMDPATSHIDADEIEQIEVIKGPYACKYGPAFGAIINIITTRPRFEKKPSFSLKAHKGYTSNWNGNFEGFNADFSNSFLFLRISGGQKDYGNYKDGDQRIVKSSFEKYFLNSQVAVKFKKSHIFHIDVKNSKGSNVRFPALPMDEREDNTQIFSTGYAYHGGARKLNSIKVNFHASTIQHAMDNKYRSFSDTVVAISSIEAINRGINTEILLSTGWGKLLLGGDLENIQKDGKRVKNMILQPGLPVIEEKLWNNAQILNAGVFAEFSASVSSFDFLSAIRVDHNTAASDPIIINSAGSGEIYNYGADSIQSDYNNFSLSIAVNHTLGNDMDISLAIGRGARSPDMTERFIILLPIGYDQYDYLGNPQLKPEINHQADLTWQISEKKWGSMQWNIFYSLVKDIIAGNRIPPSQQQPLSKDVLGVKQFQNMGWAQFRGAELVYISPSAYTLQATFTASYTYATINKTTQYILNEANEVIDAVTIYHDALPEIPPLEMNLLIKYPLFNDQLFPRLQLRYVSPKNHVSKAFEENKSPGFFIANFNATYHLNETFRFDGGVNNIFNETYYEHLNRTIIGSEEPLYEPGRTIFLKLTISLP